ncbi:MAG: M23 family metallopeptidase, partial [Deferrisomatales bacterium]
MPERRTLRRRRLAALALVNATLLAGCVGYLWSRRQTPAEPPPLQSEAPLAPAGATPAAAEPRREVRTAEVQRGDTAAALLGEHLTAQELHDLAAKTNAVFPLTRLAAGQPYEVVTVDGALESFVYEIDPEERLVVRCSPQGFEACREPIAYEVRVERVAGRIESSLFDAVDRAGEGANLAVALADVFAWDVDFHRDLRRGDTFQAVVERRYRDGRPAGYGELLAAEFVNQDRAFRAVRFRDGDRPAAYYDPTGNSLRKAFLKAPLSFSRITSGYTLRRFHPIAKTWRAHPAVDYAAPTGTPIRTVGDGVVADAARTQYNGNYVRIRHTGGYETLYLHMSRFAKGTSRGKRVTQGDVIGYVGSTGLATGPHLCFRMVKNGSPVNPMSVKALATEPVSKARRAEFEAVAARLLERLDAGA